MHAKYILWILVAASLFFAGCTKLSDIKNGTANASSNQALDCLGNCSTSYAPVCGTNNKTYWNSCAAGCAGITVARQGDCKPAATAKTCNDSDGGKDASVKGVVATSDGVSLTDRCLNASTVLEYYCSGSDNASKEMACGTGFECSGGICVEIQAAPACNDSDGGKNATVKGTVTAGNETLTDTCNGTAAVKEYYCDGDESDSKIMNCPEGTACKSGKCAEIEEDCDDSDGGESVTKKGTVTITSVNGTKNYTDSCYSTATVIEYACNGTALLTKRIACSGNSVCVAGVCEIPEEECEDSDDGKDEAKKGTVTLGNDEVVDRCKGDAAVTEYYCSDNEIKSTVIECDGDDTCVDGRCVGECTETDEADDIYEQGTTEQGDESLEDKCKSTTSVIEYYCDDNLLKNKTVSCGSDYICDDGACVDKCTETDDGKDYGEPGTTTKGDASEEDECVDADTLREFYCYNNLLKNLTTTCADGCDGGACQ